jgi:H+/Cl- antiporter ClcA
MLGGTPYGAPYANTTKHKFHKSAKLGHYLILALLGIASLIFALFFLWIGFMTMSGIPKDVGHDWWREISFVLFGLFLGVISIYLFSGAPHILRFVQSKRNRPDSN